MHSPRGLPRAYRPQRPGYGGDGYRVFGHSPGGAAARPPRRPGRRERARGLRLRRRLVNNRENGDNRFGRPGKALFAAFAGGRIVGVCGLNIDPYLPGGRVGDSVTYISAPHSTPGDRGGAGRRGDPGGPRVVRSAPIADRERVGRPVLRVPGIPALFRRAGLHVRSATGRLTLLPSGSPRNRQPGDPTMPLSCPWLATILSMLGTVPSDDPGVDRLRGSTPDDRPRTIESYPQETGGSGPIRSRSWCPPT